MDLHYTDDERAFRVEVRSFLATALPGSTRAKMRAGQRISADELRAWQRTLYERGWATPAWDPAWGGTGWSPVKQYIFKEELHMAPAPEPLSQNVNMVGPVIIAFGNEAQKRRFLPKVASLEYWFCQGFSEPGAGSDLAALRTRATRDGDHYVINGQKMWTSVAHHADWCFCLVRTDASGRKQEGITYLLIDMLSPGITVRPIITLDGHHETNEVFFDDVRVPIENRIGEEGRGWQYAKFLLGHERSGIARVGVSKHRARRARELAAATLRDGVRALDDPLLAARLAELEVELTALEMTQLRAIAGGAGSDAMASILKIKGSEMQQRSSELLLDVAGPAALERDVDLLRGQVEATTSSATTAAPNYYMSRMWSIVGGSNEIQKNILARTVLGL